MSPNLRFHFVNAYHEDKPPAVIVTISNPPSGITIACVWGADDLKALVELKEQLEEALMELPDFIAECKIPN